MDVIRIKYEIDDSALDKSISKYQKLDTASEELVKDFRAMNADASKASASISNLGNKAEQATKKASKGVKDVNKDLGALDQGAKRVSGLIAGYFTFQALTSLASQIIEVTAEFEKFRAVLTNTLGSQAAADLALDLIQDFAATTNFSVTELTSSFIKLTNAGFQPTKDELILLADVANSTGKSFDQLTEAILDANTFQFERLKEFGIKAEQAGNKIRFTFKGVTTDVAKTSDSVQQYLLGLGKLQGVAGSTAAISATLTGQISNLGDSFDQLLLSIGKQGRGGVSEGISVLSTGLTELKKVVEGEKSAFDPFFETLNGLWNITVDLGNSISNLWTDFQNLFGEVEEGTTAMSALNYAFKITLVPIKLLILGIVGTIDAMKALGGIATNTGILIRNALTSGPGKPLVDIGIDRLKADTKKLTDILNLTDGKLQKNREDAAQNEVETTTKKERKKTAVTQDELDKRFKAEMENLDKLEKLTIDRSNTNGGTEADAIRIQEDFNKRRESIFQRYAKTRELDYQFLLLKEQQLEIEYSKFLEDEDEDRAKARIEARDQILKNIDSQLAAQKVLDTNYYNARVIQEQEVFKKGEITLEQYYANLEQITNDARRTELENAIDADNEKLNVAKLSADQIISINQDISDKTKQINDLEIAEYEKKEKKKTEVSKEEQAKRRELEQQTYDLFVDIVNAGFDINQNRLSADLEALKYNTDQEIKLVGDNQARKDQINAAAAEKERALKRRQAEIDRNQAIFNIGITTALNVVKALGQPPIPGTNLLAAALAGAAGAAQLAVVLSKPLPKFAKGTKSVKGGQQGVDSVQALLMPGEAVIPTDQAQHPSLKPIIGGLIDRTLDPRDIMIRGHKLDIGKGAHRDEPILKEMQGLRKEIKKLKQVNVTIDRSGVNIDEIGPNSRTRILNEYFSG